VESAAVAVERIIVVTASKDKSTWKVDTSNHCFTLARPGNCEHLKKLEQFFFLLFLSDNSIEILRFLFSYTP